MTEMKDDRRFHKLTRDQVETLDQVLTNVIPIHGRGNFPTLEIKPKDIIHMVRGRLTLKNIKVRDVRLNGSTASHVLVKENGTGYKDLDIIFGVELPKQEDFQIIKEVVLDCLLDFLPKGVNKDKITALTMKEAYVQKMVKVFTENDKWSLISLSNNCGKNVELKFVSTLRRQFEFSVDSFQIILDTMLQCYLDAERSALKASDGNTSSVALALETRPSLMEEPAFLMNVEHQQESCTEIRSSDIKNYVKIQKCCKLSQEKEEKCIVGVASTVDDGSTVKFADIDMDEEEPINDGIAKMSENATVIDGEQNNVVETQTQLGVNTCGSGTVSANKSELCVVNSDDVSIEETNTTPTYITVTDSDTAEYTLDIEPVNSQSCLEIVHTNLSSLSKGTFDDQCTFHLAPITFLVNATLETQSEYPPPPAKKSSSHMVVLKHSSPKPPRKMSKKTTAVQSTTNSNNITCQILRSPQPFPKEPLPMQMKQSGLATKSFELSSASRKDSNSLDTFNRAVTATAPENDIQSKVRKVNKVLPEDDLPSKLPTSETAELAPPPSNATNLIDETKVTQPLKPTEKCKTMPSANHPSSQTLLEENCNSSPPKSRDCQFCSIEDENPTLPCDFPKTSEPLTEKAACPSQTLNYLSDSGDLGTTSPTSQVIANSASSPETLNQEVPCPKTKELQEPMPLILKPTGSLGSKVQSPTLAEPSDRTSTKLLQHLTSSPVSPESPTMTSLSLNTTGPPEHHCGISKEPEFSVQDLDSSGQQSSHIPMTSTRDIVLSENPDPSIPNIGMNLLQPKELPFITVMAESMYGDFEQALNHLRYRLIATRNPEEIRGGGLLKYSNLLVRDFKPACEAEIKTLERYMCSRFFIDFPDVNDQQRKIESYLRNHFIGEEKSKYDYLMTLRRVVNESTVCLMGHERRQTLNMITILALKVLGEQNIIPNANNVTCYYQPAAFMAEHSFSNYYISSGQSSLIYHPYPLHIHMQTSLV